MATVTATHLLQTRLADMRAFYNEQHMLATSENADIALIRSHIAYWSGARIADAAVIKSSRGHSYRVKADYREVIVRIADYFDHRDGVTGWN